MFGFIRHISYITLRKEIVLREDTWDLPKSLWDIPIREC